MRMSVSRLPPGEPYARGLVTHNPFAEKADVRAVVVAVLDLTFLHRDLALDPYRSRAVVGGGVYEMVVTDEPACAPGRVVQRAAYLGFVRVSAGGVVAVGDACYLDGAHIGNVVGFNSDHEPNHFNIVLGSPALASGARRGLSVGDRVVFRMEPVPMGALPPA